VVVRPEALESFYVKENKSIVHDILKTFEKECINVIYLPREEGDIKYAEGCVCYRPDKLLNGLDLCYYADAVLTGSGTLAREAACMGTTSVSFFPSCSLLSIDQHFVNLGKIFHSRDSFDIVNYVLSNISHSKMNDISRSVNVNKKVMNITSKILESM
jgi:predicted glycosyltransferase